MNNKIYTKKIQLRPKEKQNLLSITRYIHYTTKDELQERQQKAIDELLKYYSLEDYELIIG